MHNCPGPELYEANRILRRCVRQSQPGGTYFQTVPCVLPVTYRLYAATSRTDPALSLLL
jgi:hypothetical protein